MIGGGIGGGLGKYQNSDEKYGKSKLDNAKPSNFYRNIMKFKPDDPNL